MRQIGPYTFTFGRRLVIVRYLTVPELKHIHQIEWSAVDYVIDDVLPVVAKCRDLPADYRRRLERFATDMLPVILAMNPSILAPSQTILDLFPGRPRELISPCALSICTTFADAHWTAPDLRLVFFGTRSHVSSLEFLESLASALATAAPRARLTLFFGRYAPRPLRRMQNVDNRAPLAWTDFRSMINNERFHIGLAPLGDTVFARGRSITKILDHGAAGVAGLYSDAPSYAPAVRHGETGLLLPPDPDVWIKEIVRLGQDRASLRAMAEAGATHAAQLGDPAKLRSFWLNRLGVSP